MKIYVVPRRSASSPSALCVGPRRSLCRAVCGAPAFSVSGPGALSLSVSGPSALCGLCVGPRRSKCRAPALSALTASGPGALCVGAGPCVSGPGALSLSVSGPSALCRLSVGALSRSLCRDLGRSGPGTLCVGCLSGRSLAEPKRVLHAPNAEVRDYGKQALGLPKEIGTCVREPCAEGQDHL